MTIDIKELREKILSKGLDVVADSDILSVLDRLEEVTKERDEADRRVGAAERRLASYVDERAARQRWLEKAKFQWGAESHVSFDTVWAEALALKAEKDRRDWT